MATLSLPRRGKSRPVALPHRDADTVSAERHGEILAALGKALAERDAHLQHIVFLEAKLAAAESDLARVRAFALPALLGPDGTVPSDATLPAGTPVHDEARDIAGAYGAGTTGAEAA